MSYRNRDHLTIQRVKQLFNNNIASGEYDSPLIAQLDFALHTQGANFKLIHPLLIERYSRMSKHHGEEPIKTIGLDIETNAKTGEPRLLGIAYPSGGYYKIDRPKLEDFYRVVKNMIDNDPGTQIATWGSLDIQCLIRLFNPNQTERMFISRGIAASFKDGEFVGSPPVKREMPDGHTFFVDHYIPGRAMRLGIVIKERAYSIWVYNLSQFFPDTIEKTAKGLNLKWENFDRNTHLIDWERYASDDYYRQMCVASNKQDAITVNKLCQYVQGIFKRVFGIYPKLLVSAGSLADAAASSMMHDDDYNSNAQKWLAMTAWRYDRDTVKKMETLAAECFSAGYVDQFAVGYFEEMHTADISSAYPAVIRHLPDLRHSELVYGTGDPNKHIQKIKAAGMGVFTALIRGVVTIPETLKFHPITVKTEDRQNVRKIGTFGAAYLHEERRFCKRRGARFRDEEYVIVALKKTKLAPIAKVSQKLRDLRAEFTEMMDSATDANEKLLYDKMQYMVKVVDNSLYGKTVMTTPVVEDINEVPQITGYRAGDRFNQIYGSVITGRTRIVIATAANEIESNGGAVALTMTDSLYWFGNRNALPESMVRPTKTAGYFEPVETVDHFYLIKTGQYEYWDRKKARFEHKLRGLNYPFEKRDSSQSFYRRIIAEYCAEIEPYTRPKNIRIPVEVRKLVTIGSTHLDKLGLVEDSVSELKPFVLTSKQTESYIFEWRICIDSHVWLKPITGDGSKSEVETPQQFLRDLYESGGDYLGKYRKKQLYYYLGILRTGQYRLPKRLTELNWSELREIYGVDPKEYGIQVAA